MQSVVQVQRQLWNLGIADGSYLPLFCGVTSATLEQARIKFVNNSANGLHPTFWLLGETEECWPLMGELDITEVMGRNSPEHTWYTGNVHAGTSCEKDLGGSVTMSYNYGELADWHVWGLEWRPQIQELRFTMDGELRDNGRYTNGSVLDLLQESYMILGLAVMDDGDVVPNNATQLPQSVEIDWVRVSQWDDA